MMGFIGSEAMAVPDLHKRGLSLNKFRVTKKF